MSLTTRVRNLQSRIEFPYQKCLDGIRVWGHLAVEMRRETGWDLDLCDETVARSWFGVDSLDPELKLRGATSVGVSGCNCGGAIPYGLDASGIPTTGNRQPPERCPPCRGLNESPFLWATFEEQMKASHRQQWECIAPRSGFSTKRDRMIFKLFVRERLPGRRWWFFEDSISWTDPSYAKLATSGLKDEDLIQGPLELLRDIQAEDTLGGKQALARAIGLIHTFLIK